MKFSITDILWTTLAAALLFAAIRTVSGFVVAFVFLNIAQVVLPVGIVLLTIVFADQRGNMLDIATVPGWRILKRIWILSVLCTITIWLLLFWMRLDTVPLAPFATAITIWLLLFCMRLSRFRA